MQLDQLPIEVLLLVTNNLTTLEYNAVRLTCRAVKVATDDSWAREFFSTRQFSLQPHSLNALLAISKHETLHRHLKRLIVCTDYMPSTQGTRRPQNLPVDLQAKSEELWKAQSHFWTSGWDQRFLAEAVRNLPNLSTVEFKNFNSDFHGGRVRDGVAWRSYGWSTARDILGRDLLQDTLYDDTQPSFHYYSAMLQKVIGAAIECQGLKTLVSHTRRIPGFHYAAEGVLTRAFWIAPPLQDRYRDGLQHLETFMFNILPPNEHIEGGIEDIVQFLSLTPRLKHLRLNSSTSAPNDFVSSILQPCALKLQQLSKLELGSMWLESSGLEQLRCFSSLRELSLFRIYLSTGTWKELLPTLARTIPTLRAITLMSLRQQVKTEASMRATGGTRGWVARLAFKAVRDAHIANMIDPSLTSNLTVNDKRDTDLSSALHKALDIMVVDDEEFRKAREVLDPDASSSESDQFDHEEESSEDEEEGEENESNQS